MKTTKGEREKYALDDGIGTPGGQCVYVERSFLRRLIADADEAEYWQERFLKGAAPEAMRPGDGKGGWVLDYGQVKDITNKANNLESVSMEDTEAVLLALIDLGMLRIESEAV